MEFGREGDAEQREKGGYGGRAFWETALELVEVKGREEVEVGTGSLMYL